MKALIYFNQLGIVPIVPIILFLTSLSFDSTSYQINNFTTWLLLYAISPIWLGQPISLDSVKLNLILFLQLIGYASLYKKQQNTGGLEISLSSFSKISRFIDWVLVQGCAANPDDFFRKKLEIIFVIFSFFSNFYHINWALICRNST